MSAPGSTVSRQVLLCPLWIGRRQEAICISRKRRDYRASWRHAGAPAPTGSEEGMIESAKSAASAASAETVGVEAFLSEDYARAEPQCLWRKVWQHACRVEELGEVGDYVTYDVADDTILIVRSAPDRLRAFHNVCSHRGRRL